MSEQPQTEAAAKPAADVIKLPNTPRQPAAKRVASGPVAEGMIDVLHAIRPEDETGHWGAVMLTSCFSREGVSTLAAELAEAAALSDVRTVLVDANLARAVQHRMWKLKRAPGLAECIRGEAKPADCVQPTKIPGLSVLLAGTGGGTKLSVAEEDKLSNVLAELKDNFDLVVIDGPAVAQPGSGRRTASLADGVLFVIESERTATPDARRCLQELSRDGATVLGAVLNKKRTYWGGASRARSA
jgi:succinoglycan biosynthesis transport protein ExoP